jgi:hypothetical protein
MRAIVVAVGPDGNPLPPPTPQPSETQRWLSIAAEDALLADALTFFGRSDDWFDIYKALECLIRKFGGGKEADFLALRLGERRQDQAAQADRRLLATLTARQTERRPAT